MPGKGDIVGGGFDCSLVVVVPLVVESLSSVDDDAEKKRRDRVKSALLILDDDLPIVRLDRLDSIRIVYIFALSTTESTRRETIEKYKIR